jgi:hypothetical protein
LSGTATPGAKGVVILKFCAEALVANALAKIAPSSACLLMFSSPSAPQSLVISRFLAQYGTASLDLVATTEMSINSSAMKVSNFVVGIAQM